MSESYVQVPADSDGKKLRTRKNIIGTDEVHSEVVVLEDGNGNLIDPRDIRTITETLNINNPSNLDVTLSTRASEQTLAALKAALASIGSDKVRVSLVDSLPAGSNKIGSVDVANFPTDYAKDSTVNAIKLQTDKLTFDTLNRLKVLLESLPNPSNLDVALSTRASESTLNALKNALSSVGTDKVRVSVIDSLPAGANKIGSVDVDSLPSLPAGTNTIGNVGVNNFPTDYAKEAKQILIDANGHGQVDVLTLPSLPAGTNKIGSVDVASLPSLPAGTNTIGNVNAIKSGTWNIDNLLNPHPVQLTPEYKLPDANQFSGTFAPTAAGSTTIITAVSGKVIRVYDFSLWNSGSADVTVELYFGTSGKRLFKGLLAAKTGVLKTFVRPWESNAGDSLVLALSAAGTCDYCIGAVQA